MSQGETASIHKKLDALSTLVETSMKEQSDHIELLIERRATVEREKSDTLYAPIVIKTMVYSLMSAVMLAVLGAILNLVINKP